ncbi:hypothetical protein EVAR_68018_1 [Eumeta japonica]|uniref:Uncharacterized protein n=1 Tax=Eumeta variegata TaxID=151549 RepID=A0A4C1ZBQ1_EUMVA|nr:hypothetical protein EVAR_68018_1 [Eumeta japonica]
MESQEPDSVKKISMKGNVNKTNVEKSLSEECEDLGVDSPSASELFPEADLLFAASPAHDHGHDNTHTSQSTLLSQSGVPQPDLEDQIATDHLLPEASPHGAKPDLVECSPGNDLESGLSLGDVGVVTVSALNHEEFARSHPNTTFHSEPTDDAEVQPFSMSSLKGRHITSTIFHSGTSAPTTVLMTAAAANAPLKYTDIDNVIDSMAGAELGAGPHGLTRFDNMLSDTRELHLGSGSALHTAPAGAAAHVIRRVCYDNDKSAASRYLLDEPDTLIAGDDPKISVVEDSSRDATLESIADDDRSSPERHAELFWESNSASERSESRRPLDFSSDSDKCCKSPSLDETNSTDSSGLGARLRLDTVIKEARGRRRSGSADGSSADDAAHPPVRTYPAKRPPPSLTGKTRAGDPPHQPQHTVRRRASGRGVVKRGCHCCNGSPAPPHHTSIGIGPTGAGPPRPKKPRTRRPPATAAAVGNVPSEH